MHITDRQADDDLKQKAMEKVVAEGIHHKRVKRINNIIQNSKYNEIYCRWVLSDDAEFKHNLEHNKEFYGEVERLGLDLDVLKKGIKSGSYAQGVCEEIINVDKKIRGDLRELQSKVIIDSSNGVQLNKLVGDKDLIKRVNTMIGEAQQSREFIDAIMKSKQHKVNTYDEIDLGDEIKIKLFDSMDPLEDQTGKLNEIVSNYIVRKRLTLYNADYDDRFRKVKDLIAAAKKGELGEQKDREKDIEEVYQNLIAMYNMHMENAYLYDIGFENTFKPEPYYIDVNRESNIKIEDLIWGDIEFCNAKPGPLRIVSNKMKRRNSIPYCMLDMGTVIFGVYGEYGRFTSFPGFVTEDESSKPVLLCDLSIMNEERVKDNTEIVEYLKQYSRKVGFDRLGFSNESKVEGLEVTNEKLVKIPRTEYDIYDILFEKGVARTWSYIK